MIHHGDQETRSNLLHESLTEPIIGAALEVHRALGPGLLESAYEECLCRALNLRSIPFRRPVPLPVVDKGVNLDCGYRNRPGCERSDHPGIQMCRTYFARSRGATVGLIKTAHKTGWTTSELSRCHTCERWHGMKGDLIFSATPCLRGEWKH